MKKVLLTLAALFVAISLASCGASAPAAAEGDSPAAIAASLNNQLASVVIDEFAYNSARVAPEMVKPIAETIKSVQQQVPVGYVLKIYGHNDKFEAKSSIGYRRAKAVYYELRGYKLMVEGTDKKVNVVAANAYNKTFVEDEFGGSAAQRRVTFKVEKK